ncbi:MAG: hypothetical protein ACRYFU_25980 [Janthinobacterium lividum]
MSTSWRTERAKRSRRHTTSKSPLHMISSAWCSSDRLRCAPEAVSVNIHTHLAALSASSWDAEICAAVEMRM